MALKFSALGASPWNIELAGLVREVYFLPAVIGVPLAIQVRRYGWQI